MKLTWFPMIAFSLTTVSFLASPAVAVITDVYQNCKEDTVPIEFSAPTIEQPRIKCGSLQNCGVAAVACGTHAANCPGIGNYDFRQTRSSQYGTCQPTTTDSDKCAVCKNDIVTNREFVCSATYVFSSKAIGGVCQTMCTNYVSHQTSGGEHCKP